MASPTAHPRVVVLGAGLAGLAAAYELARGGAEVTVLEKEDHVGGLAWSWQVGPYWLDTGPHRFHSGHPSVRTNHHAATTATSTSTA